MMARLLHIDKTRMSYDKISQPMKAIYLPVIAIGATATLSGCSSMRLSNANALADDVYYDGSASPKSIVKAPESSAVVSNGDVASYESRVASYVSSTKSGNEARDFSQIQQYYANANSSNGEASDTTRTLVAAATADDSEVEVSDGYWVDGFWGSESDQSYAERIIRFHRPLVSVNYYSPFFTAARYSGDWNIYVDGYGSTYLVPTWTNPWYNDYYYGSGLAFDWYWSRPWRWGMNLAWGYGGWYGSFGFGWGFYDYAWGWPHHHHHWWGHHEPWHGVGHGFGVGGWDRRPYDRPVNAARANTAPRSYSAENRIQGVTTNPNGERAGQRYRSMLPTSNRSYTRSADGRSTTSSVSDAGSTGRSYYSTNTRRSTVSQGETANGSTATTSRSSYSTNTRRSTSGVSSSTYGSSSSSRSTYTPSRSSSRSSVSTTSPANSRETTSYSTNTRRGTSSSYSPSKSQTRSSVSTSRSSGSSRSSYSGSSQSSRSTFNSGRSFSSGGRSTGSFSGGGRSSGGSVSSSRGGRSR